MYSVVKDIVITCLNIDENYKYNLYEKPAHKAIIFVGKKNGYFMRAESVILSSFSNKKDIKILFIYKLLHNLCYNRGMCSQRKCNYS